MKTTAKTTDAADATRIVATKMTADYHYMGLRNTVADAADDTTWIDDMWIAARLLLCIASVGWGVWLVDKVGWL